MNQRQAEILCGLVAHYITTGQPVSSANLAAHLDLDLSPATIRHILHELDETGYIFQPHTSAGRVPTDQGYRYYVDQLQINHLAKSLQAKIDQQFGQLQIQQARLQALTKLLAKLSNSYVLTGHLPDGSFEHAGLSNIIDSEESLDAVKEVASMVDRIPDSLNELADQHPGQATVYIGQENPLFNSAHTSTIITSQPTGRRQRTVIVLIGPKRMPYQQNIAFINHVANLINQ